MIVIIKLDISTPTVTYNEVEVTSPSLFSIKFCLLWCYSLGLECLSDPIWWRIGHQPVAFLGSGRHFKRWGTVRQSHWLGLWRNLWDVGPLTIPFHFYVFFLVTMRCTDLFHHGVPPGHTMPAQAHRCKAKGHGLKPRAEMHLSSFWMDYLRYVVTMTETRINYADKAVL